jgi:acetyl esterase/lipase
MTDSGLFVGRRHAVATLPTSAQGMLSLEYVALVDGFIFDYTDATVLSQMRADVPGLGSTDVVERTERKVPGDPEVSVRVHRPRGANGPFAGVFSVHGGGYVLGSSSMDDLRFESWCPQLGVVGVSVEYRLAPECPYPGPLEDCYRGLTWVFEHAEELELDCTRIGLYGVSAGGGLAVALALLRRDRGEMPLAFQILEAPMLDDRQTMPSSKLDDLAIFNREANEYCWRSYLGDLYGSAEVPYYGAPARTEDLSDLPPTFLSVGTADGFRDEDIDFGLRLNQAGVPTELHVYPGAPHGFQMFVDTPVALQARRDSHEWLARVLG